MPPRQQCSPTYRSQSTHSNKNLLKNLLQIMEELGGGLRLLLLCALLGVGVQVVRSDNGATH